MDVLKDNSMARAMDYQTVCQMVYKMVRKMAENLEYLMVEMMVPKMVLNMDSLRAMIKE